jgi:hypothetical protein
MAGTLCDWAVEPLQRFRTSGSVFARTKFVALVEQAFGIACAKPVQNNGGIGFSP